MAPQLPNNYVLAPSVSCCHESGWKHPNYVVLINPSYENTFPARKKKNLKIFGVVSRSVPEGLNSMNNNRLRRIIKDLLQKKRYLIVLDDVWRLDVWDALKYALPKNRCGSRVMLTTRNADVASTSGVESIGKVYNLESPASDGVLVSFMQ
jgi:hypothetical protein